jgi:hypothetical protein
MNTALSSELVAARIENDHASRIVSSASGSRAATAGHTEQSVVLARRVGSLSHSAVMYSPRGRPAT